MRLPVTVLGVDPGKTTGFALVHFDQEMGGWRLLDQGETREGPHDTNALFHTYLAASAASGFPVKFIAAERFVEGRRSSKLSTPEGARKARAVVGGLHTLDKPLLQAAAAQWKPWMTARRWEALRFRFPQTINHDDHKCAAGVAVYTMVWKGFATDPLRM